MEETSAIIGGICGYIVDLPGDSGWLGGGQDSAERYR